MEFGPHRKLPMRSKTPVHMKLPGAFPAGNDLTARPVRIAVTVSDRVIRLLRPGNDKTNGTINQITY